MNFLKNLLTSPSKDIDWFKTLQERVNEKYNFFGHISSNIREFNKIFKNFSDKLDNQFKNFESISHTLEDQYIFDTYKLMYQMIVNRIKEESAFSEGNLKILELHLNNYKNEIDKYNTLKDLGKTLNEEKEALKANKADYHKVGADMETTVKKFVEVNKDTLNNLLPALKNQLNSLVKYPKKSLKKYKDSIQRVNELSIEFNKMQNEVFALLPSFGNEDNQFFSKISKYFLETVQDNFNAIELIKKNMESIKQNEKKNDLNNLINETEQNKNEEQKIYLIQYQSGMEFSKCKDKNEFDLYAKTVETINQSMEDAIFPNYNYDIDLKFFNEGKLVRKIFELEDVDEKIGNEFLDTLDDKQNHRAIFIILSQLRTNSTFHRPKSFIELIGKAFNKMILMANKNEIYDYVKNCIILSQTYFYNDENNNKRYLFEEIKPNKILNNSHFWRDFINAQLKNEFERFKINHSYPNYDFEKGENIPKKIKQKLNQIIFSQLLSFISNLNDFDMDKRLILKIADEFIKKYNYLSESNIEGIYEIISKEKDDIEKLRKEYDSSLESELIKIKEKDEEVIKTEENKIEEKEDLKNEKKIESKIEDIKEEQKEEKKEESTEEKKEEAKEESAEETKDRKKEDDIKNEK